MEDNKQEIQLGPKPIRGGKTVVRIDNVTKNFTLNHTYSLKDSFVGLFRKNEHKAQKFNALKCVSVDINEGETIGLVGLNGSGKSTLLKCISGVQKPDSGSISVVGKIAGLIEVGAGFHPDLTGRENVFLNGAILGMTKDQIESSYEKIVAFSEVEQFMETNVRYYSSGMFMRLAFSVAVHSDPDVFLIDEVLSVGDAPFRKKCFQKIAQLQEQKKTMIIVSHNAEQILQTCHRVVWLEKGKVVMVGDPETIMEKMAQSKVKNK